ncbi:MAG: DNA translocase FtsK [Clostridia bacterium]|nr:DNA translocase FtsK [Clostridia bacterium]
MAKKPKKTRAKSFSMDYIALFLISGLIFVVAGAFVVLAVWLRLRGAMFEAVRSVSYGLAGAMAFLLPVPLVWAGVMLWVHTQRKVHLKVFFLMLALFFLLLAFVQLITYTENRQPWMDYVHTYNSIVSEEIPKLSQMVRNNWELCSGEFPYGGGCIGCIIAFVPWRLFGGPVLASLLCAILIIVVVLALFRFKPKAFYAKLKAYAAKTAEKQDERRKEREKAAWLKEEEQQQPVPVRPQQQPQPAKFPPLRPMQQTAGFQPVPEETSYTPPRRNPYARPESPAAADPADETPRRAIRKPFEPEPAVTGEMNRADARKPFEPEEPEQSRSARKRFTTRLFSRADDNENREAAASLRTPRRTEPVRDAEPAPAENTSFGNAQEPIDPATTQPAFREYADEPEIPPVQQEEAREPMPDDGSRHRRSQRTCQAEAARPRQPQKPRDSWSDDDTPPWEEQPETPSRPVQPVIRDRTMGTGEQLKINTAGLTRRTDPDEEAPKLRPYIFPDLNMLRQPEPPIGISPEEDSMRARVLEKTLASFKVDATVRHITHGPAVSRYELELAPGINVNRVTSLGNNIAMDMEAKSVRIEAPIPGKSLIGIEVPNRSIAKVTLREILESRPFQEDKEPLTVALGRDIAGAPVICNLARMPHLMIAGATGSGKSVCINAIINSLLYRSKPTEVKMILIDPKVVELQCYNGVPHLLLPVVSDPHKASAALGWAVDEMMDRYRKFEDRGVRGIDGYNSKLEPGEEKLPRLVIIIDELADLMMVCKRDVEERICRIAQLARAAGIHLIVATQRPSVDVITGLIKANIPSRIAFKVTSYVDSRTILDGNGAEQLLGWGDMLYKPTGAFSPTRIQGCFLTDEEVNTVTDFIRSTCPADYDPDVIEQLERSVEEDEGGPSASINDFAADEPSNGPTDMTLLAQCIEIAVQDRQVSTSMLQRRLRVGYSRAGRLVDEMEKRGIVSQQDGSKPRQCLISREEFEEMKATGEIK